jgi:hypothetical protein
MQKRTTKAVAPNKNKLWSDDDRRTLLDLIARHVARLEIAKILGRTFHAVEQEIYLHHGAFWKASGHPEARHVAEPVPTDSAALARLESKVDGIYAMLRVLLRSLGEGIEEPEPPNGRARDA